MADKIVELRARLSRAAQEAAVNGLDEFCIEPQSPIEQQLILGIAIHNHAREMTTFIEQHLESTLENANAPPRYKWNGKDREFSNGVMDSIGFVFPYTPEHQRLFTQCAIGAYKADLLIEDGCPDARGYERAVIECDGHDFHERTKLQAAHDKKRDRFMQKLGLPVLRFTGSEIYADAVACAAQIAEFFDARRKAKRSQHG